jgi:8-oxo-dGTP diphosphatase
VSKNKRLVHAAIGIIRNPRREILLAIRPPQATMPGLWEFPGGKIEIGETPELALIREIREEIGIDIQEYSFMLQTEYEFPDRHVILYVYEVLQFSGIVSGREQQHIEWKPLNELHTLEFPASNQQIIKHLLLLEGNQRHQG